MHNLYQTSICKGNWFDWTYKTFWVAHHASMHFSYSWNCLPGESDDCIRWDFSRVQRNELADLLGTVYDAYRCLLSFVLFFWALQVVGRFFLVIWIPTIHFLWYYQKGTQICSQFPSTGATSHIICMVSVWCNVTTSLPLSDWEYVEWCHRE